MKFHAKPLLAPQRDICFSRPMNFVAATVMNLAAPVAASLVGGTINNRANNNHANHWRARA